MAEEQKATDQVKKYTVTQEDRDALALIKRGADTLLIEDDLLQKLARRCAASLVSIRLPLISIWATRWC